MSIIDGKALAEDVYREIETLVEELPRTPLLTIFTASPNLETQKYLALKKKKAAAVHIDVRVVLLNERDSTHSLIAMMKEETAVCDALIVQLPLPSHFDTEQVLASIPPTHDADALNPETHRVCSPVVGAFARVLTHHKIPISNALVTIIGNGRLVGKPSYTWFIEQGAHVSLITRDIVDITHHTKTAHIIVCGAGVPGLLKPDMISEGVVILDAGTSEDGGVLRGDADSRCAEKASFLTPVPGGIGPITIAMLLKNVVDLARMRPLVL